MTHSRIPFQYRYGRPKNQKLALHGGPQAKTTPYGKGQKHEPERIAAAMRGRLEGVRGLPMAMGPSIKKLRSRLRDLFGVAYAIPTSSGTAAIHAGLIAMGVQPGDEVITTPCTDHGTVIGIMQTGAIPVFADVDPATMMIEAHTVEPHITDRTSAILPVHLEGCPADMTAVMGLARRYNLKILEDCAQAWLAEWEGQRVGTFGDVGIFSMNESKHISCGEGGVIITNHEHVAAYADAFVDKAYDRSGKATPAPAMPAMNLRLSELNAELALLQLDKVEWLVGRRHALGERLGRLIDILPGLRVHRPEPPSKSSYWHGIVHYDPEAVGTDVSTFAEALKAEGLTAAPFRARRLLRWPLFETLNTQPNAFGTYRASGLKSGMFDPKRCPHADLLPERALHVFLDEFCTNEDIDHTADAIHKVAAHYGSLAGPAE